MEAASQIGSGYQNQKRANTAPAVERPTHIVKWHGRDVPGQEKVFYGPTEEAEAFALQLVHQGDALPNDIVIFENTGITLRVSCEYPAKAANPR